MSVSVRIPTILRTYTGGAAEVTAEEGTLREVLAKLDAAYPGLAGRILDEGGKLRRFVNVYVGEEDVRLAEGLETQVPPGTQVSVIPAVAGGRSVARYDVKSCPVAVGTASTASMACTARLARSAIDGFRKKQGWNPKPEQS